MKFLKKLFFMIFGNLIKFTGDRAKRIIYILTLFSASFRKAGNKFFDDDLKAKELNDADPEWFLKKWGVEKEQIPIIVRNLKIEAALFLSICLIPLLGIYSDPRAWVYWASEFIVVIPAASIINLRRWQIDCLKNLRYTSFTDWCNT